MSHGSLKSDVHLLACLPACLTIKSYGADSFDRVLTREPSVVEVVEQHFVPFSFDLIRNVGVVHLPTTAAGRATTHHHELLDEDPPLWPCPTDTQSQPTHSRRREA